MLGFERLQALFRSRQLAKQFETARAHVIRFQARCRGYLMRQKIAEQKKAACIIQAYARGMLARHSFQRMKREVCAVCSASHLLKQDISSRILFTEAANFFG